MIVLFISVRAVFVGVLFTPRVGWLEVRFQVTETDPNSLRNKYFTNRQDQRVELRRQETMRVKQARNENDLFTRHILSLSQLLSHARKFTCA